MTIANDIDPAPSPPITARLVNDDGETYSVSIAMDRAAAVEFLQAMWRHVNPRYFPDEEDAVREWTDRARDVRSTFSSYGGVCIQTHAWHPQGDRHVLDAKVLEFLRERGLKV